MRWVTVTMLIGLLIGWVAEAYGAEPGLRREYAEFRARLEQCARERGLDVETTLMGLPEQPSDAELRELRTGLVRRNAECQDRPIQAAPTASSFVRDNSFSDPLPPVPAPEPVPAVYGQVGRPIAGADYQYDVHNTSFLVPGVCWLRVRVDGLVVRWAGARSPNDEPWEPIPPEQISEFLPPNEIGYIEVDAGQHNLIYTCHPVRSRSVATPAGLITSRVVDDSRTLRYGSSRVGVGRITPGELGGGALWASR